jgi:hypothetical protein
VAKFPITIGFTLENATPFILAVPDELVLDALQIPVHEALGLPVSRLKAEPNELLRSKLRGIRRSR